MPAPSTPIEALQMMRNSSRPYIKCRCCDTGAQGAEDTLRATTCTAISHGGAQAFRLHRERFEKLARRYPELRAMALIGSTQGPQRRSWPAAMMSSANGRTVDSKQSLTVDSKQSMTI